MNRGRRRGGPGLTGLRDGVKRRLFDPHSVPTKPDAKYEVNRLVPLTSTKPLVHSLLGLRGSAGSGDPSVVGAEEEGENHSDKLHNNLFKSKAMLQFAFRNGPFYHPLPERPEGIDLARIFHGAQATDSTARQNDAVLLSHLLLAHEDIKQWGDGAPLKDIDNPDTWYPKEVVQFTKSSKRTLARQRARKKLAQQQANAAEAAESVEAILPEVVPDISSIQHGVDAVVQQEEGGLTDIAEPEKADRDSEADSEDARWNGEVNVEEDVDDIDDEEIDNDYCQTYFDNGEGDLSDDALGGDEDDGGGSRYYD